MDRGCSFSGAQVGHEYESKEGVSGKITVVVPYHKRLTWKRKEWDNPSRRKSMCCPRRLENNHRDSPGDAR